MDIKEIKSKSESELKSLLLGLKKEQLNLRFQKAAGTLSDTSKMSKVKKNVAQIKTVLAEIKGGK